MNISTQGALTRYENREKESISRLFEGPELNERDMVSNSLQNSLAALTVTRLYSGKSLNDIAQETVSLCYVLFLSAAERLRAKDAFDGQHFLICHLLILREITLNLDLTQKDKSTANGGSDNADLYSVADEYCLRILDAGSQMGRTACYTRYHLFCWHINSPFWLIIYIPCQHAFYNTTYCNEAA